MNTSLDLGSCWINGRTLRKALNYTKANHSLPVFQNTDRVAIDPRRDAYLLGAEFQKPFPFCTGDGGMATILDMESVTKLYEFGLFKCTASAFESSLHWIKQDDTATEAVEALGREVLDGAWSNCYEFSHQVCDWGGGGRVWGNLNRHYTADALQNELRRWFSGVASSDIDGIECGLGIKGLGVSFASKHLRMLAPNRYAVLDDVLSVGLGFALNRAGYALFMHELNLFKEKYAISHSLAHIEWALFGLVRQSVRGQQPSIKL